MTRTLLRLTLGPAAVVAALAALVAPARAQDQADFRWHGVLAAGKTVTIKGINGDVQAGGTSGREVEVTAVKRAGHEGDPADVRIVAVQGEDGVTICALYPSRRGRPENTCEPGGNEHWSSERNDTEVNFTVRLPAGVRFDGTTVNGSIRATGLTADASVSTVNGSVELQTRGTGEARTVNGKVNVVMGQADWTGRLHFATVNGGISVTLPANTNADVHATTVNGDMQSDFPLTLRGKWGPREMNGTIGSGGRTLDLETVNGSITLRRGQ